MVARAPARSRTLARKLRLWHREVFEESWGFRRPGDCYGSSKYQVTPLPSAQPLWASRPQTYLVKFA